MGVIPNILHRTLPKVPRHDVPDIWATVVKHTDGWERRTYQSPRNPADWPITGHLFGKCHDRAMEANLVRLEALWVHGGVYVDSDVSLVRPLEPLLDTPFFIGWECGQWLGTAVIGAVPEHPATGAALEAMMRHVEAGGERSSSPKVLTPVLAGRDDVTTMPVKTFYKLPFGFRHEWPDYSSDLDVFTIHHWHASWM